MRLAENTVECRRLRGKTAGKTCAWTRPIPSCPREGQRSLPGRKGRVSRPKFRSQARNGRRLSDPSRPASGSSGGRFCHDFSPSFCGILGCGQGKGAQLFLAYRLAAATALLLTAGALFALLFSAADSRAKAAPGSLRGRGRARGLALADRAVEGRAFARRLRRGEAARGRAFADRARRTASRPNRASGTAGRRISGSPRSRRRPRDVACEARARARAGRMQHDHARNRRARPTSRRGRARRTGSVWPLRNTWNRATENLYSAWIEKLFDAPLDATPSWPALHEVLRDRSRNFLFNHLGLGEDQMGHRHPPRLRRPSVLFARVFRVQDGAAVRVLEMLARRRRRAAEVPRVVEHPESEQPRSVPAEPKHRVRQLRCEMVPPASPQSARARAAGDGGSGLRPRSANICADRRRRRPFRVRRARALSDDNTDYYPVPLTQETLRPGTVYADPYGHMLMLARRVAQIGRRGGRLPRRRRAARRHGRAQALLARQLPVRAGSRARRPRLQALPADRARQERRLAAADQCRDRQESAVRRFFARSGAARGRRLLRPHGRRDVAGAARSFARDEGGDHVARGAGEGARDLGRKRAQVPEQRARRRRDAGRRGDLRDDRRLGRFRDAVARSASVDRDRCRARVSRIASRGGPSATPCRRARASPT